jgi:hypothetical protein
MDQHTLFTVELAVVEQSSPRLAFGSPISVPAGCAELGIGCYTDSRLRNALGKELTICGSAEFMAEHDSAIGLDDNSAVCTFYIA